MLLVALWSTPTLANEEGSLPLTAQGRMAEYQRLADEMLGHARRGHWGAVERLLLKIEATGQPHTQEVLVIFAQSSARKGNLFDTKEQLEHALEIRDDEEIRTWLNRIDAVYSPVLLAADLPANYRLTTERKPFQLEERGAVEYAQVQILENSYFKGLLPRGSYTFGPYGQTEGNGVFPIEVRGGRTSIDLRTKDEPTAKDRRKRAKIDKLVAKQEAAAE